VCTRNLWIVNHYAQPPHLPGGTRHYDLARGLRNRGWDVTILASNYNHWQGQHVRDCGRGGIAIQDVDGVRFVWVDSKTRYHENGLPRMLNMLEFALRVGMGGRSRFRKQLPRPECIIGSSPHLLAPFAAHRIARRFRIPLILELRDLWPETLVGMGVMPAWHPVVRFLRILERFLYREAASIVTLLPATPKYLRDLGMPTETVTYLPNGVDVSTFVCPPKEGVESRSFVVCYAGAHGPANGLGNVLDAAAILAARGADVEFRFYGSGPEKEGLKARAEAEGLASVGFRDPVPKSEVVGILCESDALLVNYSRLGITQFGISPNKLWEYMAVGRPILFAHEAANNPVSDSQCGLSVPPQEPKALADAIEELMRTPSAQRMAMGERGRSYVMEHHDLDRLGETLSELVQKACEREAAVH